MLSRIVLSSFFPNSGRRCPHIISSPVVVPSCHFRITGVAVELHHGVSEQCQSWRQKSGTSGPTQFFTFWATHLPLRSMLCFHMYLLHLTLHVTCLTIILLVWFVCMLCIFISEHTPNFQTLQRTLATPPFTLYTWHSTLDVLGSTRHTYTQHFPLSLYTPHFTL